MKSFERVRRQVGMDGAIQHFTSSQWLLYLATPLASYCTNTIRPLYKSDSIDAYDIIHTYLSMVNEAEEILRSAQAFQDHYTVHQDRVESDTVTVRGLKHYPAVSPILSYTSNYYEW